MVKVGGEGPRNRGSFGIPDDVQEEMARNRTRAAQQPTPSQAADTEDEGDAAPAPEPELEAKVELPTDATVKKLDPVQALKEIGITLSEDDMTQLIFKGSLEKTVDVYKTPKLKLTATLKTLTAEELDVVDELMAEDIDSIKMTRDGASTRRSMWLLSLAVTQLNGRPVRALDRDIPNAKDLSPSQYLRTKARLVREVLQKMNPHVLAKTMGIHTTFAMALNEIVNGDVSPFL